jgi:hypothetical protein
MGTLDNGGRIGRISRRSRGSNSAVECDLAKVEVAGSNPVSRFGKDEGGRMKDEKLFSSSFRLRPLSPHCGGVAKW